VGWILPLEGTVVQIDLPEQWDRDVAAILEATGFTNLSSEPASS
jgi:hypothetical protein